MSYPFNSDAVNSILLLKSLEAISKYEQLGCLSIYFKSLLVEIIYSTFLGGIQEVVDYQITIDMAKEICMIQRSDKGKQARQYFLQLEKEWNTPEKVMARALLLANRNIESLTAANNSLKIENKAKDQQIAELKPKADYTDVILQNKSLVTITSIAKDYGMSGSVLNDKLHRLGVQYKMSGQWFLYSKYQDKGYTHSQTQTIVHTDGTTSVKMNTKWTQKGRLFLYELLKRNDLIPMIER